MTHVFLSMLGRLETVVDGRRVELAGRRERAVLGVLLLHVGEVVSIEALIDGVWGEAAPRSARHMVHEYVSRIRSSVGPLISTRPPGYVVERDACELDVSRFTEQVVAARSALEAGRVHAALRLFDEALALWRGDVLCDIALEGDARDSAARLDDQRRAVRLERVDLALALGRHHELIPDLERAVAAEPLDERARAQLMLALYRDGRQTDALARHREGRSRLVEEFGIEPGTELRALEQAILQHDPELVLPPTGEVTPAAEATASPRPRRGRRRRLGAAAAVVVAVAAVLGTIGTTARNHAHAITPVRGNSVAVLDAATGRLLGSMPMSSRPDAITFGAGSVWVSFPESRTVSRISPASRHVVASIPLDVAAQSLASAGSDVWAVGSTLTDAFLTLERIDPTFDSASRAERLPLAVAGDTGSVAGRGGTVLVAPRSGLLTRIDAHNGHTLGRVDPNASPASIAVGLGGSWLAYPEANLVIRVDRSGAITQIPVGRDPSAIAIGARAVWVANELDGTVKSIDPDTSAVITTIRVGHAPSAIAAGDGSVWVASSSDGTLTRIDERTGRVAGPVRVGGSPQALVVADGQVWASVQPPPPQQPTGGTAVVSVPSDTTIFDPAQGLGNSGGINYATCTMLLNFPDEPGAAGLRIVPDAARALPTVSKDGRSYLFDLRPNVRFSPPSGQRVTAQTFKFSIERSLSPRIHGPGQLFLADIVGAKAYIAGKARHIAGITARGDHLTVRLTHPAADLPARIANPLFCAVPTNMPLTVVTRPIPSAGPYYTASATPGRGLVLLRNPNYHGDRPRRLRRINIVIGNPRTAGDVAQIEASSLDYAVEGAPSQDDARLARLYGPGSPAARHGRQRYFVNRVLEVDYVELNAARPLFASRRMRRAVNYAVDRRALAAGGGTFDATAAHPAQMYLPPGMPGFRDEHVYPLTPDLATARRLASGNTHHSAVLYCLLQGGSPHAAQVIANNLAAIGIHVHVHCMPGNQMWTRILTRPNEPWDMVIVGWAATYNDPADYLSTMGSHSRFNLSHLHDARYTRMLRAAGGLSGLARALAYARIDHELVRDAAPRIVFANEDAHDFFSARVGCHVYQPVYGIDLGALCISHRGTSQPESAAKGPTSPAHARPTVTEAGGASPRRPSVGRRNP